MPNLFSFFKRKGPITKRIERVVRVEQERKPKPHSKDELHKALAESVGR